MKTLTLKTTPINLEKLKCDDLHERIMDFKEIFGTLPPRIMLYSSRIPDECREKMEVVVDDTAIPIIELSERPC